MSCAPERNRTRSSAPSFGCCRHHSLEDSSQLPPFCLLVSDQFNHNGPFLFYFLKSVISLGAVLLRIQKSRRTFRLCPPFELILTHRTFSPYLFHTPPPSRLRKNIEFPGPNLLFFPNLFCFQCPLPDLIKNLRCCSPLCISPPRLWEFAICKKIWVSLIPPSSRVKTPKTFCSFGQ